jgi:polyhydroxyalkanoate synthase
MGEGGGDYVKRLVEDPDGLARNLAEAVTAWQRAAATWLKPREALSADLAADEIAVVTRTLAKVGAFWTADAERALDAQTRLTTGYMALWNHAMQRLAGAAPAAVAEPDPRDRRFQDPEWRDNPFFDVVKQLYLITARWAADMVDEADDLDPATRMRAAFYVRQIAGALSPSNFVPTNPELIRRTVDERAANLARGAAKLAEDIAEGHGDLKIRQSDKRAFEVGVNLATTPGKVVFQNELIQLIQYAPTTETVARRPLLIVPPWINKFYILDLTAEKSFVRWCVDAGLTVFLVSWVNPGPELAEKSFADYMTDGVLAALGAVLAITREPQADLLGYCVGGTLVAATLARLAATADDRVASATLLTTQVDFEHAGELKVFIDPDQLAALDRLMLAKGYLDGAKMAAAFNMLKPNELIWPFFVKAYLQGDEPAPFDLLHWNADSTRMPAANHSFYLRSCYLENNLSQGRLSLDGVRLDLGRVTVPIYNLATRDDHIAPAKSVFVGSSCFGGPVTYVLGGSGHIAGVVNPPDKNKYQFWTGGPPTGDFDAWQAAAAPHPGSWWPHWRAWLAERAGAAKPVKARKPGGRRKPLEEAPGSYVRVKA